MQGVQGEQGLGLQGRQGLGYAIHFIQMCHPLHPTSAHGHPSGQSCPFFTVILME